MKRFLVIFIFFVIASPCFSHPHLFIESYITVCFENEKIDKIKVRFEFDRMFSADLVQNFDKNQNNAFEPAENDSIYKNAFINLENYSYFVHIKENCKKKNIKEVDNFKAEISGETVSYSFTLDTNVDLTKHGLDYRIAPFDHSYYIDVRLLEKNVNFEGEAAINYKHRFINDEGQAYYFGQIIPNCVVIGTQN